MIKSKRTCYYCVFKDCSEIKYDCLCNLGLWKTFSDRPCMFKDKPIDVYWRCKYFRNIDEAKQLIEADNIMKKEIN